MPVTAWQQGRGVSHALRNDESFLRTMVHLERWTSKICKLTLCYLCVLVFLENSEWRTWTLGWARFLSKQQTHKEHAWHKFASCILCQSESSRTAKLRKVYMFSNISRFGCTCLLPKYHSLDAFLLMPWSKRFSWSCLRFSLAAVLSVSPRH